MSLKLSFEQKLKIQRVSDLLTLALWSPVFIPAIATVLALSLAGYNKNPIYIQKRVGKDGKEFNILKARTMRDLNDMDPSGQLKTQYDSMTEEEKADFDDKHRINAVGRFLRKTRLDELPQIFNIAVGEMSFVGPRPHKCEDSINRTFPKRQRVRPGLTGEGKLAGLNSVTHDEEGKKDEDYVDAVEKRSVFYLQVYRQSICAATPWALIRHRKSPDIYKHCI